MEQDHKSGKQRGNRQPRIRSIARSRAVLSFVVLVIVIVAGGGIAWFTLAHGIIGSTTIKIATDLPVSGADESNGKSVENGVHLAIHASPNVANWRRLHQKGEQKRAD